MHAKLWWCTWTETMHAGLCGANGVAEAVLAYDGALVLLLVYK